MPREYLVLSVEFGLGDYDSLKWPATDIDLSGGV